MIEPNKRPEDKHTGPEGGPDTKRHICIHGHFYQPPRENPWLEGVERQDSAYPYHDWNERITADCYGPNSASRILEPSGKIAGIMNNYSRISFNMGPTLLSWMESQEPTIYEAILEADRISQDIYSGHGSALAQVFNHMIMPLANSRDKRTQVIWGIKDFEHRFGRKPEGMWLSETAVDHETLELLAEHGIRFTILAPRQCSEVRPVAAEGAEEQDWIDVSEGRVDPRRAYLCRLPSGNSITLFFYDGPISQDIAFAGLLNSGETFANRLLLPLDDDPAEPQLVHIATDGETYGHHHHRGEMALSYCLYHIEEEKKARVTIYAEFLERFPPTWEARIFENSSWSCIHGVERWRSNCGCHSGMHGDWNQAWRGPLREALDWLREQLIAFYQEQAGALLKDPWVARDEYIDVILNRDEERVKQFLARHANGNLSAENHTRVLTLLELQRNAMLMYTSCGWFFDELSGIETTQVLQYAARAIQLAAALNGPDLDSEFAQRLEQAPTNIAEFNNGKHIYETMVKPAAIDLMRVGAHYAMTSLFEEDLPKRDSIYCYGTQNLAYERFTAGRMKMATGTLRVRSRLTWNEEVLSFAVLHLGDQNLNGGIRQFMGQESNQQMRNELREAWERSDVPEIVRVIDRNFEGCTLHLRQLFRDTQRTILNTIFQQAESNIENFYRSVYQDHYHLINVMQTLGTPLPRILQVTAEFVLNLELRRCLEADVCDEEHYRTLEADIKRWRVNLDQQLFSFIGSDRMEKLVEGLARNPFNIELIAEIQKLLNKYEKLGVPLNLWYSQNVVYKIGLQQFFIRRNLAEQGDAEARRWVDTYQALAEKLGVKVD